jgi:hypothetical protein
MQSASRRKALLIIRRSALRVGRLRSERCGTAGPVSWAVRVPVGCLNPRELPVKAGDRRMHAHTRIRAFAGDIGAEPEPYALLAMQKVEGSNPFSRFQKACVCRSFSLVQSPKQVDQASRRPAR